jgi:hypothetical protein
MTWIELTLAGTTNACSAPVELNVHVTVLADCEQPAGSAFAGPANAAAQHVTSATAAPNDTASDRGLGAKETTVFMVLPPLDSEEALR